MDDDELASEVRRQGKLRAESQAGLERAAVAMYVAGASMITVAETAGVTRRVIETILARRDVAIRPRGPVPKER